MNILDSPHVQPGDQAAIFAHRLLTRRTTRPFRLVSVGATSISKRAPNNAWPLILRAERDWDEIRIVLDGGGPINVRYGDCLIVEASTTGKGSGA